jgi:Ethanolamine utilization protein EutJ (predicted chaperonin)
MQVTAIDHVLFADLITSAGCELLHTVEAPGAAQAYVAVLDGIDILIVTDAMTGGAIVITDSGQDHESGGSIHDHARLTN